MPKGRRIVALAIILVQLPALAQQQPPPAPVVDETLAPYVSTKDSVRLPDGRNLHFVCMGKGSPTVILTAGMGDLASSSWSKVQPRMARMTRICAWDRPGFGLSDGTQWAQTVATSTADLEAALATGKIAGPYIMVGHSLGGYESLLFADRHPDAVVGMVLIDPSVPDQQALLARIAPALAQPRDPATDPLLQLLRKCAADLRNGTAKAGRPDPDGCFTYPPTWPPALRAAFAAHASNNPLLFESVASHLMSFPEDSRIAINPARDYGNMPLIVLTATENPVPPDASADVRAQMPLWAEAWNKAHDALAALSKRGINVRVPGANHYIQQSKPQAVIDAVKTVIRESREPAPQ